MATKRKKPLVKDKGMNAAMRRQKSLNGFKATIGVHRDAGQHDDAAMTNARLAAIHEFGATFQHPGGTPYTVGSVGGSSRSGGFVGGGAVKFLPKGSPDAIGITRAHQIRIPERSFLRSAFDKNRRRYERLLERETGRVIDGKQNARGAVAAVGEVALGDVVGGINAGIAPPNKPATARAKGSTKPLIKDGALKQSIVVKVGRRK